MEMHQVAEVPTLMLQVVVAVLILNHMVIIVVTNMEIKGGMIMEELEKERKGRETRMKRSSQ